MRFGLVTAYAAISVLVAAGTDDGTRSDDRPASVRVEIPGTALSLTMVPVPNEDGTVAFWMSDAEISWDHYDVFVYELDEPIAPDADAITRPTRPYISADRGWGHADFPALSVSHRGAKAFCSWLNSRAGEGWRLPTLAEWNHACAASGLNAETLDEFAWNKGNAKRRTHRLRSRRADALGLYDLQGNVSEWCRIGPGPDDYVLAGGCYADEFTDCGTVKTPVPEWNDTDPQIPKSIWWLADAPFAGFRVICTSPPSPAPVQPKTSDSGDLDS